MKYILLDRTINQYLIAGTVLSVLIFVMLLLNNYKQSLDYALKSFSRITANKVKMDKSVEDMDRIKQAVDIALPAGSSLDAEEVILLTLDKIEKRINGGKIVIRDISKENGEVVLPVTIEMVVDDFSTLADSVARLQSFVFPYIVFNDLAISRDQSRGYKGVVTCTIDAALTFPDLEYAEEMQTE